MRNHRTSPRALGLIGGVIAIIGLLVLASVAQASKPTPTHKVTLCHRTGAADNPYVSITVDIASVANAKDARGHDSHDQIGNGLGGDIIPPYKYVGDDGTFVYTGKNLDTLFFGETGRTILDNGCQLVKTTATPEPSESTPASVPPTPEATNPNTAMGDEPGSFGPMVTLAGLLMVGLSIMALADGAFRKRR